MAGCVFCEIVSGRSPAYRVLEDEHAVAFLDIAPASPGHCLVVPRRHARNIWEISEDAHGYVARMVHRVAAVLRAALAPDGVNVIHSTGAAAGQEVLHFHVHVVPRWRGDGLPPRWSASPALGEQLDHVWARLTGSR